MLTCKSDKDKLDIGFDVPVPDVCLKNMEFNELLKTMTDNDSQECIKRNTANEITGLVIKIGTLNRIIDQALPVEIAGVEKKTITNLINNDPGSLKTGLQINFHQRSFDSPERYWNFILNQGNFLLYFFNRIKWFLGPKNEYVTDFPLHVDLESASTCNMNCPMCYRKLLKHTGQMDFELFKKAVDECAENHVYSIRLSWRGETLTHPRIKEMIAYATSKIKNVSFLTNAFYIDEDMIDCFIDAGVNYVAVSFDGIKDIYEKIRAPAEFKTNYDKLLLLKNKKNQKNSLLPQIRLCTIWPAIKDDPDEYYTLMKDVSDYIVCNPYINFAGPMEIKHDFVCQYPWERIVVAYNGDAQCCTGWNADDIILGNIKDKTIYEMWHSSQMDAIRTTHAEGKRMSLNSCAQCRHGSKGDPDITIDEILERKY